MSTWNRIGSLAVPRRLVFAAVLGPLLAIAGGGGAYVYHYVPLLAFDPVCRDYQRGAWNDDWLRNVTVPLSTEFKQALVQHFEAVGRDVAWFEISDGMVYLTFSGYYSPPQKIGLPNGETGEIRYNVSRKLAWQIFQARLADGSVTEAATRDFMTPFAPSSILKSEPELMRFDECGFMEEFVTADGRFARN